MKNIENATQETKTHRLTAFLEDDIYTEFRHHVLDAHSSITNTICALIRKYCNEMNAIKNYRQNN